MGRAVCRAAGIRRGSLLPGATLQQLPADSLKIHHQRSQTCLLYVLSLTLMAEIVMT